MRNLRRRQLSGRGGAGPGPIGVVPQSAPAGGARLSHVDAMLTRRAHEDRHRDARLNEKIIHAVGVVF